MKIEREQIVKIIENRIKLNDDLMLKYENHRYIQSNKDLNIILELLEKCKQTINTVDSVKNVITDMIEINSNEILESKNEQFIESNNDLKEIINVIDILESTVFKMFEAILKQRKNIAKQLEKEFKINPYSKKVDNLTNKLYQINILLINLKEIGEKNVTKN